ncbi:uncharacterized protein LOC143122205 [Alosa pseudoharengus]|uniref:uncharacterized protein LOC143122205 n=1 Tax=Alosa pseudoharengus TaxID=34774 RepID=UPI003F8926EA
MTMTTIDTSTPSLEINSTSSIYNMTETITVPANSTEQGLDFGCIPAEVAFVVMASVGSLVVFLLASILVLACQVCRLQCRQQTGRHTRSNVDLVSGAGYWGAGNQAEGGGIAGPCDASVMLEEVKTQEELEGSEEEFENRSEEGSEVVVTEDSRGQPGITVAPVGELVDVSVTKTVPPPPPPPPPMPGSTSTESCLEMGRDLEGMPLVV